MTKNNMEKTLAIIKPDAVLAKNIGNIVARIEQEGFLIKGIRMLQLTKQQAQDFYAIHKSRSFFASLVEFMISGPVVVLALEKKDAVKSWRTIMGATNPADAAAGTIRKLYGTSIDHNATHGSDSQENGAAEVAFFFPEFKA